MPINILFQLITNVENPLLLVRYESIKVHLTM